MTSSISVVVIVIISSGSISNSIDTNNNENYMYIVIFTSVNTISKHSPKLQKITTSPKLLNDY